MRIKKALMHFLMHFVIYTRINKTPIDALDAFLFLVHYRARYFSGHTLHDENNVAKKMHQMLRRTATKQRAFYNASVIQKNASNASSNRN